MDIVISHTAALHVIRATGSWSPCACELPRRMPSATDMQAARAACPTLQDLEGPLGVLIAEKTQSRSSDTARIHVWSADLPEGALFEIAPGVRCVSPLLLPVLMASCHSEMELVLLMAELMGLYAVREDSEMELTQRDEPLITREELLAFLDKLGPAWGTAIVRRAFAKTPVMAASPQEARLYLRATLPYAKGGYRLGRVVLNDAFELKRISAGARTLRTRKPDLLFVGKGNAKVCLDYMGAWHERDSQVALDTQRRNELIAYGFKPYEIFKHHYDDLDYMDGLMDSIRADLGLAPVIRTVDEQREDRRARRKLCRDLARIRPQDWQDRLDLR